MNAVRRIVKNSGASLLAQVSTPATSFVLVFFIARLLGASGLGKYSSALALLFIFQAFTSLGFTYLITREVSQDTSNANKFLVNGSFIGLISSIICAGVMCLFINLLTDNADTIHAVYVLSVSLVPYTLSLVCQAISRGFEKIEHIAISMMTGNLFKLLFGLSVLFMGYGLLKLMVVIAVSYFIIFILSLYLSLQCIPGKIHKVFKIDIGFCKWMIRATLVFALIIIVSTIRMNIDVLILNNMMGDREVGFYSAAYKLVNICALGISFYIMAVQPVIFRLYKSSFEKFETACTESIRYFFIVILPIIVGTTILSDKFVLLIFKEEFLPSTFALSILIWLLILTGFNQIFANALIAANYQKINLQANLVGMVGNISLNVILIPQFGFIGASIANVASTLATLYFQQLFISKHLFKIYYIHYAKKPFISSILMGMITLLFKDINLFLLVMTSAAVYLLSLLMLKTFTERDLELVKKFWRGDKDLNISKSEI